MTAAENLSPFRRRRGPAAGPAISLAAVLALSACAWAQGGGWAAVEGVTPGSRVEVRSRAGTVKGTFVAASPSGVEVQVSHGSRRRIGRTQIARVYLLNGSHVLRDAAIGAGAGAVGGVAFGAHRANCRLILPGQCQRAATIAYFGALGGAVGALIGAVIGRIKGPARTLIYERGASRRRAPPRPGAAGGAVRR